MKRKRVLWSILFAILLVCSMKTLSNAATFAETHGRLQVKGTKLVDSSGKTVQLKGISTHGISWYPEYVSKASFQSLRDQWGANTVRLAMYTAEYNGYCVGGSQNQKNLKKTIDKGVKAATELGMYVIIDWHILSDGNPNTYKSQSVSFFKEMAKKYKNNKNVIYEICNEPNGDTSWSQIKTYAKAVIKAIRAIDKNAIIIVGTPTWSQDVNKAAKSPITGYKNIMYGFHFYANTHKDAMRGKLEGAIKAGLPVFVSEFGISEASGNGSVSTSEGNKWIKLLNKYNVSYVCWNLSNKNETSALIKSSSQKKSNWKKSDLTTSGQWIVKKMAGSLKKLPGQSEATTKKANTTAHITVTATTTEKATTIKASTFTVTMTTTNPTKSGTRKKVTAKAELVNSWKSNSNYYYQYNISIANKNKAAISTWKLKATFKNNISINQSWNATFSASKNALTVKPISGSWNETVAAKQMTTGIGFIVCSKSKNELQKMEVTLIK